MLANIGRIPIYQMSLKNAFLKFCFRDLYAQTISDFEIIVPTPHNTPIIMWGTE
jgi:hypothetical protein